MFDSRLIQAHTHTQVLGVDSDDCAWDVEGNDVKSAASTVILRSQVTICPRLSSRWPIYAQPWLVTSINRLIIYSKCAKATGLLWYYNRNMYVRHKYEATDGWMKGLTVRFFFFYMCVCMKFLIPVRVLCRPVHVYIWSAAQAASWGLVLTSRMSLRDGTGFRRHCSLPPPRTKYFFRGECSTNG